MAVTPDIKSEYQIDPLTGQRYLITAAQGLDANGNGITDSSGNPAANVTLGDALANERNIGTGNAFGVSVPECNYASVTADTDISTSAPGLVFGVLVTAATATNVIEIRDSNAAAAGTVVLSIPAATAIGTFYDLKGAKFNTGVYADFTGTGTIVVLWRPQS